MLPGRSACKNFCGIEAVEKLIRTVPGPPRTPVEHARTPRESGLRAWHACIFLRIRFLFLLIRFVPQARAPATPTGPRTVLRHAPELLRELDAQTQIVRARILRDRFWVLWWSVNGVPSGSGESGSDAYSGCY